MQLDKFTDYGLRILMTLAVLEPERVSVASIAKRFRVSEHHLSKVATELAKGGFVRSERGRSGGLRLAKSAGEISIGAVVRWLKQDDPIVECFATGNCVITPACGLRTPLQEAQEAFFKALDGYSLEDVVKRRVALEKLLTI